MSNIPIAKSPYALAQVSSSLIFGVYDDIDVYLGEVGRDKLAEVLGEGIVVAKGRLTPLYTIRLV